VKFLGFILKNLLRNKRRNLLTVLSIAVSLFVFSSLISLPNVIDQLSLGAAASRLVCVHKAGFAYPLPEAYRPRILATPHVEAVVGETYFGGIYRGPGDQFPNTAIDPDHLDEVYPDFEIQKQAMADFKRLRTACLVGTATMKRFHWKVGQQIMLRGTIFPVDVTLKIVGTLGDKFPTFLIFRRDYLEEMLTERGWVNDFWIKLDRPESAPSVIAALDETFANSAFETRTETEASFIHNFVSTLGPVFALVRLLAAIVIVSMGLVAANTAAMSMRERRPAVAIMRSIGFSPRLLMGCMLAECTLIGLAGGLIGSLAAYVVVNGGAFGSSALMSLGVIRMAPAVLAESIGVGAALGLLSGLFPASSAVRRSIVDTLRPAG